MLRQILAENCQVIKVRPVHILEVFQLSSNVNCHPTVNNLKSFRCNKKGQQQYLT